MNAPRLRLLLFALLSIMGFTLVVVPVGPAASEEAPAEPAASEQEATVELLAFQARPERLEIKTGTTVTWANKEPADYPVKSGSHEIKAADGSFASPAMAPGTRWSHRFNLPGEFTYGCAHHGEVAGTIVVTGPPVLEKLIEEVTINEPKPDDPTSWGFQPADLVVTTGMTVEWRNNGTNVHTVSSDDKRLDSGDIAPGATWKFKFDEPGAFVYHCTPHPWMTASVRVVLPGSAPPPPPPTPAPEPTIARAPREAAPAREGRDPVRHEVDIVEPNPANPNSWMFDPATLDVRTGDTVVWRNTGRMEHSITALDGSFDSRLLAPGATWSRTFTSPAFLEYRCTPHPWMRGVLRVADLTGPPPAAPPGSRTAAGASMAPAPPPTPGRDGSGPVIHWLDIVEPAIADAMSWSFNPKVVEARAGDAVLWRNTGTLEHSVTGDTFDRFLGPGETYARTFDTPGVYAYRCTPHPWMKGIIRVADAKGGAVPAVAGLENGGSSGPGGQASESASSIRGHIVGRATGNGGASAKLGWLLLLCATVVGLTRLLSWSWEYPVPAGAWVPGSRRGVDGPQVR
jgi:plastocyanin